MKELMIKIPVIAKQECELTEQEKAEISKSADFADMPVWPYAGSVRKLGDIIAVKFGEAAP